MYTVRCNRVNAQRLSLWKLQDDGVVHPHPYHCRLSIDDPALLVSVLCDDDPHVFEDLPRFIFAVHEDRTQRLIGLEVGAEYNVVHSL
jgi:hypothetical protein